MSKIIDLVKDYLGELPRLADKHPAIAMIYFQLLCNIDAVMIQPDTGITGKGLIIAGEREFETRQEALAFCFNLAADQMSKVISSQVLSTVLTKIDIMDIVKSMGQATRQSIVFPKLPKLP